MSLGTWEIKRCMSMVVYNLHAMIRAISAKLLVADLLILIINISNA